MESGSARVTSSVPEGGAVPFGPTPQACFLVSLPLEIPADFVADDLPECNAKPIQRDLDENLDKRHAADGGRGKASKKGLQICVRRCESPHFDSSVIQCNLVGLSFVRQRGTLSNMDNRKTRKRPVTPPLEARPDTEVLEFERELKVMAELLLDIYLDKRRRGTAKQDAEF